MRRSNWLFAKLFLTLVAIVSLSFAATEVFAATNTCPNNGGFPYLGECTSDKECTNNCRAVHGGQDYGACDFGCCICQY